MFHLQRRDDLKYARISLKLAHRDRQTQTKTLLNSSHPIAMTRPITTRESKKKNVT